MKYSISLTQIVLAIILASIIQGCAIENTNPTCIQQHQGFIKVVNNYQQAIRVYIDKPTIYSYNYDLPVANGETKVFATATGTHDFTVTDESGDILDQAQTRISHDCDTVTISKTGGSGGGGGGDSKCISDNWGVIKVQNTYGQIIRVYIDVNAIYSYNYTLLVPVGQTRYVYNANIGSHIYTVSNESGDVLDQAQIHINNACDSVLISKNIPASNSTSTASGCANNNWGIIKASNIYNQSIRVYIDKPNIYSYNYDLFIPATQSRFYYLASQGGHNFTISDESGDVLDQAQAYIDNHCDTFIIGPKQTIVSTTGVNGCAGADWGIIKVINNKNELVRVYFGSDPIYSYNYNMLLPANSTRYYYNINTGSIPYAVMDESFNKIDQGQINIFQSCDVQTITIN